jgi:hypothetical protein
MDKQLKRLMDEISVNMQREERIDQLNELTYQCTCAEDAIKLIDEAILLTEQRPDYMKDVLEEARFRRILRQ